MWLYIRFNNIRWKEVNYERICAMKRHLGSIQNSPRGNGTFELSQSAGCDQREKQPDYPQAA